MDDWGGDHRSVMNRRSLTMTRSAAAALGFAMACSPAAAPDPAPDGLSAADLASRLSSLQQNGSSLVRLRMEITPSDGAKSLLQLQIKSRRTGSATDVVYHVLWPKEQKNAAVLLRKSSNRPATGWRFSPPDQLSAIDPPQMNEPLFGSDLSYEDIVDDFFAWPQQAIVGTEVVDRVNCRILESKPGRGGSSSYSSVKSWVDTRRFVPLRVEKFGPGGRLVRRIDTTRVVTDDKGRHIPANLTVRRAGSQSVTELDGARLKLDVTFADREFTSEGLTSPAAQ
jgi:hypothetical protein